MIIDVIDKLRKEKESLENLCLSDKESPQKPDVDDPNINVLKFDAEHTTI